MSWQVTVEEAHGVAEHGHPCTDAAFIPLKMTGKGEACSVKRTSYADKI